MSASDHETRHYVRTYLNVFAALMALTIITVAASYVHLAVPLAIAVALAIAIVKGSLVASFFMHLISEKPLIFAVVLITAVLFAALMILPVLTMMDSIPTPYTPWSSGAIPPAQGGH
jgi:cytochrome c oxidase subunit 4